MKPRVVVLSLASDFGCQVQITNFSGLLDLLSSINLTYWQLATGAHMPDDYDVAVIEGAVTLHEHVELLKQVRKIAKTVIVIGACAGTGGVPGMALLSDLEDGATLVYGKDASKVAQGRIAPAPVHHIIDVDFAIPGCPINPEEFSFVLQRALLGLTDKGHRETMCAECKMNENPCFYMTRTLCLGLITTAGCGSFCVNGGRPCTGCRGIAPDANLDAARDIAAKFSLLDELESAIEIYNTAERNVS